MSTPPPIVVIDTNVLLDIYSCHDLVGSFDLAHQSLGDAVFRDPDVRYRRERARSSLLLAVLLDRLKATTCSLKAEPLALMLWSVPRMQPGLDLRAEFTTFFVHFVKDYVLPSWQPMLVKGADETANKADVFLIDLAKRENLPLITNEGYTAAGLADKKMRKAAKAQGVVALTPREYYEHRVDEDELVEEFLHRFEEKAPVYLEERRRTLGKDASGSVLGMMFSFYRFVLRGELANGQRLASIAPTR